jgi:hypothetical protein
MHFKNFDLNDYSNIKKLRYKYWPIECTLKPSFVGVFEVIIITYIYWPIERISKLSFIKVL